MPYISFAYCDVYTLLWFFFYVYYTYLWLYDMICQEWQRKTLNQYSLKPMHLQDSIHSRLTAGL